MNLTRRPRRLRRTAQIRNLVHEVDVRCDDLIYPVFVTEGENVQSPIESMPGIYHYSLDRLAIHLKEVWEKGVRAVIFFGVPDHKDACGSGAGSAGLLTAAAAGWTCRHARPAHWPRK